MCRGLAVDGGVVRKGQLLSILKEMWPVAGRWGKKKKTGEIGGQAQASVSTGIGSPRAPSL